MIFAKASTKEAEPSLNRPRHWLIYGSSLVLPFLVSLMVTLLLGFKLQITNDADSYIPQEDSQIKTRYLKSEQWCKMFYEVFKAAIQRKGYMRPKNGN
jgi:cytochrome bd-type quinol oxidase subunit 2